MLPDCNLDNTSSIHNDKHSFRQFFEDCFHLYYESMHRYAYSILRNNHDASDIVQQVFLKWWEKGEMLIIHQDVRHYLLRSVHNQSLNYIRNKKNRKTQSVDFSNKDGYVENTDLPDLVAKEELNTKLATELGKLPPQCKLIFYKSRFEAKKYSEIAGELQLSVKTVEAQIGKALRILREKFHGENMSLVAFIAYFINRIF